MRSMRTVSANEFMLSSGHFCRSCMLAVTGRDWKRTYQPYYDNIVWWFKIAFSIWLKEEDTCLFRLPFFEYWSFCLVCLCETDYIELVSRNWTIFGYNLRRINNSLVLCLYVFQNTWIVHCCTCMQCGQYNWSPCFVSLCRSVRGEQRESPGLHQHLQRGVRGRADRQRGWVPALPHWRQGTGHGRTPREHSTMTRLRI